MPHQSQPAYSDLSGTPPGTTINQAAPTGTINGSNTAFTLAHTPMSGTEQIFLNGQLLDAGGGNDHPVAGSETGGDQPFVTCGTVKAEHAWLNLAGGVHDQGHGVSLWVT